MAVAKKTNQLVILDFYADWCRPCNEMDKTTYVDSRVITHFKNYLPIKIDIDKKPEIANRYDSNAKANGGFAIPTIIVLNADGQQLAKTHSYLSQDELLAPLKALKISTSNNN